MPRTTMEEVAENLRLRRKVVFDQIAEVMHDEADVINAVLLAECAGPNSSTLRFYSVNGYVVIVQIYGPGDDGWTHYLPSKENRLDASRDEIRRWCGL